MKFPVFDLHCDTAFAMLDENGKPQHSLLDNSLHFDLQRAGQMPGYVQCFACFTSNPETLPSRLQPEMLFDSEYCNIAEQLKESSSVIRQAVSYDDIQQNRSKGLISGILTLEGTAGFGYDSSKLEELYRRGFRITTLGWNEGNPLTGSHKTGGGLTDLGKTYVHEAQRIGMLVDVSHISDEAFWDIMSITDAPIIATHSNSRSICNVSRNLTDEMFRAICHTGGVTGINLYTEFLGDKADLDRVCDHMLHFMSMDPDGRHICLGGDLDGCESLPAGFDGVQHYPKLAETMSRRGLPDGIIYNIFWNNAVDLFRSLLQR